MAQTTRRPKDFPGTTTYASGDTALIDGASTRSILLDDLLSPANLNGVAPTAVTRVALKALDPAKSASVFLLEKYRLGQFVWMDGDYSAQIAADTYEAVYIKASSVAATVGAWVRSISDGRYMVDWWLTVGNTATQDTAAVKAAIQAVPSGAKLVFTRFKQYNISEISATTRGHIHIDLNGALINNTTQVATGVGTALPILRVFARTQDYDVTIENGIINGPRLSSSTTLPSGGYGGDPLNPGPGYPSGIDIPIGRNVKIKNCIVSGTYFAGIEAHYCSDLLIEKCNVFNHGYAGILTSDCVMQRILDNDIDDTGSTAIVDGYGITVGTSYNDPGYAYGNKNFLVKGNNVTRCKRKCIDVHDGLAGVIDGNFVKGFGYSGIYAVGEGAAKNVGDVTICDNFVYGDASFLSGAINHSCIYVGAFDGSITNTNMRVTGNHIGHLTAPVGIFLQNNTTGAGLAVSALAQGNTFEDCTFSANAIRTDAGSQLAKVVLVTSNIINANCSTPIFIQNAVHMISSLNIYQGTASSSVVTQFSSVTYSNALNNLFNGTLGT